MSIYLPLNQLGALAHSSTFKPVSKNVTKAKVKAAYTKLHARVQRSLIGFPEAIKEVRFHDSRQWRLDYAWPAFKIGLEIHGGNHTNGRHVRGKGFAEDRAKMNEAQLYGWLIIECTPDNLPQLRDWLSRAFALRAHESDTLNVEPMEKPRCHDQIND